MPERPIDPMTLDEAASILGCAVNTDRRYVARGVLPATAYYRHRQLARADVEALALQLFRWKRHVHKLDGYWLTGQRAAKVLDVSVAQLNILAGQGLLPFETHADGTRLYRRQQLEVVARARAARWYRFSEPGDRADWINS